jgi:hypothetical protein
MGTKQSSSSAKADPAETVARNASIVSVFFMLQTPVYG